MEKIQVFLYLLLTVCWGTVDGKPIHINDGGGAFYMSENLNIGEKKTKDIAKYLTNYGYTETYTENKAELKASLMDFQYFAGLLVTGELDSNTAELMQKDRCGMKDPSVRAKREGREGRARRYVIDGTKWKKNVLKWRYNNSDGNNAWRPNNPRGIREDDIRDVMKKAMGMWEKQTNIKFEEDKNTLDPDIWIKFVSYRHEDPYAFDGPGGTLAHAFFPLNNKGISGDVHFDDDETYTINNTLGDKGRDLMWIATHEFGHSLGLQHSQVKDAVMYPIYTGFKRDFDLKHDDKAGIQNIYGAKEHKPKLVEPKPLHKICPRSKVTAVWDFKRDGLYMMVTQEGRLYTVSRNNKGILHPNITANNYYRIPDAIDAVFQSNLVMNDNILYDIVFTSQGYYIFKVSSFFQPISGPHGYKSKTYNNITFCTDKRPDDNSPLKLNFPEGIRVDAVMKWPRNNKVYFFTGDEYWRYDETKKMFDCHYPKSISSQWSGLPGRIDSAYSSSENGETFFTKGENIYRMRGRSSHVIPVYPKSIKEDLLKCET